MTACCVSGCKNRHSSASTLKFYRIPCGKRPFQANRRRLWLRAIQEATGSTGGIKRNARICGAHFVSGEASLDHDNTDFVPSVFTCCKPKPTPRKKVKRPYGRRRRCRHRATGKTAAPDDSAVDSQSFACLESESELLDAKKTTPEPSPPKEGEQLLPQNAEETLSTKTLAVFKIGKLRPVVLLKPVVAPAGGFQCEQCSQNFHNVAQLVRHKQSHEEETKPYICDICGKHLVGQDDFAKHQQVHKEETFPCNMCHRSFTTSHNLKRHKLLHVKDGRKCPLCGVMFCRRHNHILFQPRPNSVTESEEERTSIQPQNRPLKPKNNLMKCISSEIPAPVPELSSPPPVPQPQYNCASPSHKSPLSSRAADYLPSPVTKHPELPDSLQVFSPQHLTSALLEVQRDYEYILSKPVKAKQGIVKEEPVELPLISPDVQSVRKVAKERIAYDMEIVL